MANQYPVIGLNSLFDLHYVCKEEERPLDLTNPKNFILGYLTALFTHADALNAGQVVLGYETTRPILLIDTRDMRIDINTLPVCNNVDGVLYVNDIDGSINVYLYAPSQILVPVIRDNRDERITYSSASYMQYRSTYCRPNYLPLNWYEDHTDYISSFTKRRGNLMTSGNQCRLVMA